MITTRSRQASVQTNREGIIIVTYRRGAYSAPRPRRTSGAIDTVYRGYRFRSRMEARFAVMFDRLNLHWEYELEGFHTAAGPYLPDFWIPELNEWVEIKGPTPSKYDMDRMNAFALDQYMAAKSKSFTALVGIPERPPIVSVSWRYQKDEGRYGFGMDEWTGGRSLLDLVVALAAARSARFEHGEVPA